MLALGNTSPTRDLPLPNPEASDLPQHIAIIMDGNRRWASARGLPKAAGHTVGARKVRALVQACHELAPSRGGMAKPMRVLICGIPNVGKSTLINTLTARRAAKTGDEAGITKLEQRITLADDFYLYDTPGVLWPRIIVAKSGYNLAASGAIGRNAFNEEEVALELLEYLKTHYPQALAARYKLSQVDALSDEDLLTAIGRQRGALQSGQRVNLQKAAEIVIYDFRAAALGRITLETTLEFAQWLQAGQQLDAQRQVKKDAIELDRKIRFKQIPRPS